MQDNIMRRTIATAATAKEPQIMPGSTLLGMKGTNVDHMTCISNDRTEISRERENQMTSADQHCTKQQKELNL
jgi:hypothetical protein